MNNSSPQENNKYRSRDHLAYGPWVGLWLVILLIAIAGILPPLFRMLRSHSSQKTVVVYTSQDQVYAEPILNIFSRQTGIRVQALYDSEMVKTVGLVNRLLGEKDHPQCDLFWNNEELRTRQLEAQGVLRQTNAWQAFGHRTRQLVVNTNLLRPAVPQSLTALTNKEYSGKVALAYPLFGTTSTHFLALRQAWGEERWLKWCRALQANKPFVVDGNSVVVQLVGKGEALIGLTDSDDVRSAQREGMPVKGFDLIEDGFLIRNTVGIIRNGPHSAEAELLCAYLKSESVQKALVAAGAIDPQIATLDNSGKVDWEALIRTQQGALEPLKEIFLR